MAMAATPSRLGLRLRALVQHPAVRIGVAVVIGAIVFAALHALTREISLPALRAALAATPARDIAAAVGLTVVSFLALGFYDVMAIRTIGAGTVPSWLAMATGMAGSALSNMVGFALLTGGAFRARVYAARGLPNETIGNVLALSWLSVWMAVALSAGAVLAVLPEGPATHLGLPLALTRGAGFVLLGFVAAVCVVAMRGARTLHVGRFAVQIPGIGRVAVQLLAGLADIGGAAGALYVLLPDGVVVAPATFFVAYVVAIVVGLLSHSPGGLGAFEATLLVSLGLGGQPDVLAALVLYRLVYHVLPFAVTALVVAAIWARAHQRTVSGRVVALAENLGPLVPPLAGGAALLSGTVLLFSGSLPAVRPRLAALDSVAPLAVIESSHLVGSALGVVLIVLARGLANREARAWSVTMLTLAGGIAASLLKGLDYEEALLLAVCALVLAAYRTSFYRHGEGPLRLSPVTAIGAVILIAASVWLGLLAYRHTDLADLPWWRFALFSDAPRFLRGSVVAAVTLLALGIATLLARRTVRPQSEPVPETVRRLVAASPESEANIALLGDKAFLVAPDESAFLMYGTTAASMIAKGDPFGERAAGRALAWRFREQADRAGRIPAFYAVGTTYLPTYLDMGLAILKIGEIARCDLTAFSLDGGSRKTLRQAASRAGREHLAFRILPAAGFAAREGELRRVSDAWLDHKQGQEKSFALGRFDPAFLANFDHAVMEGPDGRIAAFANLWYGAGHEELAVDLMRYDPQAPAVAMNALFAELMVWGKAAGFRWFNLGAVPFAGLEAHPLASRWNRLGALLYRRGGEIYDFEGLRAFKEKFDPVWTPNYLACPGGLAAARVLIDVNQLISGGARGLFARPH